MIAKEALDEVQAAAKRALYFFRFISGINTEPIAATSATAEPEISAKNSDTPTLTIASPPRTKPMSDDTKLINRRDIPPVFISAPARTKRGMAISGKDVAPLNSARAALKNPK